jgi:hypothetical protein
MDIHKVGWMSDRCIFRDSFATPHMAVRVGERVAQVGFPIPIKVHIAEQWVVVVV